MAEREVRITLRDRQVSGSSLPSDALFGEPFINLFDGVLRFSGVTGGNFEPSNQSGVFEVGSTVYNQKISNRLSINNNFIISGDTGIISTYGGLSGPSLVNKFLSGTSSGFIVADLSAITSSATAAGNEGDVQFKSGANLGADSLFNYSDSTNTLTVPSFSAVSISATSLTNTRVVFAGSNGALIDDSTFTFDALTNILSTQKIIIGSPGQTGTTAIVYGDVLIMGESISGFTSQLYIEDNIIELNYNPTASTESTSLGAGWNIQDGSGVAGTDVFFDIRGTGTTLSNRSFSTNLEDIRIRETGSISSPNGVRVIAENDTLDGGSY